MPDRAASFEAIDRASNKDDQRIDLYSSLERDELFIGWSTYFAIDRALVTTFVAKRPATSRQSGSAIPSSSWRVPSRDGAISVSAVYADD